ncbi:MAG: phosphatase PAP2 family protein [Candidatus Anstonellales archaeon]
MFDAWDIAYGLFILAIPLLKKKPIKEVAIVAILSLITLLSLKLYFAVPRPCSGQEWCPASYSFPSGHTLFSFSFSSYYVGSDIFLMLYVISVLTGMERVISGVHTPADVVFSLGLSIIVSTLARWINDRA